MKKLAHFTFGTLILSLISSCSPYDPTGENFVDIKLVNPDFKVKINGFPPGDTIPVLGEVILPVSRILNGKKELELVVRAGSTYYFNITNQPSFKIDTRTLPDGITPLKLSLKTSTNTGSLGDILEAEAFVATGEWYLKISNEVTDLVDSLTYSIVNGAVVFSWDKYRGTNFSSYELFKVNNGFDYKYTTITDLNKTSYELYGNLEEKGSFYIKLNAKGTSKLSPAVSLNIPVSIKLSSPEKLSANEFRLKWTKPILYKNVGLYSIEGSGSNQALTTKDTSMIVSPAFFGDSLSFFVSTSIGNSYYPSNTVKALWGEKKLDPFTFAVTDEVKNLLIVYDETRRKISKIEIPSFSTSVSVQINSKPIFAQDKSYFAILAGKSIPGQYWKQIEIYSVADFSKVRTFDLDVLYPLEKGYVKELAIINDKLVFNLAIDDSKPSNTNKPTKYLSAFSISTGEKINEIHSVSSIGVIFNSGNNLITKNGVIYDISGTVIKGLATLPQVNNKNPDYILSTQSENLFISVYPGGTVDFFKMTPDYNEVYTFDNYVTVLSATANLAQTNGYIQTYSMLYLFSLPQQTLIKNLMCSGNISQINGYLISNTGVVIEWK